MSSRTDLPELAHLLYLQVKPSVSFSRPQQFGAEEQMAQRGQQTHPVRSSGAVFAGGTFGSGGGGAEFPVGPRWGGGSASCGATLGGLSFL